MRRSARPIVARTFSDGRRWTIGPAFLVAAVAGLAVLAYRQTAGNLEARGIRTGFGFLSQEAGFAIGETIPLPMFGGAAGPVAAAALLLAVICLALRVAGVGSLPAALVRGTHILAWASLCVLLGLLATGAATIQLVDYGPHRSLAMALATGFANTALVSVAGIVLASLLGLVVGLGRLSSNFLVRSAAGFYVETLRNVPLLIQVFFWYFGVLRALPPLRGSIDVFGFAALNNRGVFLPRPEQAPGFAAAAIVTALVGFGWLIARRWSRARREQTGRQAPVLPVAAACLLAGLGMAWLVCGPAVRWSYPVRTGFNFQGGFSISPEFAALLFGVTAYTAAFIAEIVRGAVQGVSAGQREAARALGLSEAKIVRLVVLPQAMRVIFPPLISQYLSLVKDSSLGFAIAFPELVSVSNTAINQTGQPIELLATTIGVFMALNLFISAIITAYSRARPWTPT